MALEGLSPFADSAAVLRLFLPARGGPRAGVRGLPAALHGGRTRRQWTDADAVLPAFAACLGLAPANPLALLVTGADFVTALGWDGA